MPVVVRAGSSVCPIHSLIECSIFSISESLALENSCVRSAPAISRHLSVSSFASRSTTGRKNQDISSCIRSESSFVISTLMASMTDCRPSGYWYSKFSTRNLSCFSQRFFVWGYSNRKWTYIPLAMSRALCEWFDTIMMLILSAISYISGNSKVCDLTSLVITALTRLNDDP